MQKVMHLSWASVLVVSDSEGSKKSTPYAAQMAAETATKAAVSSRIKVCRRYG